MAGHGVERVADQVDQHLLQAISVAQRHRLIDRAGAGHLGTGPAQAGIKQGQGIVDGMAQRDRGRLAARFAGEIAQLAGDAAHAVDQVGDAAEVGARGVDVAPFEEALAALPTVFRKALERALA